MCNELGGISLDKHKKQDVVVDKTNEPRKDGISNMIGEGGLGADKYYVIKKKHKQKSEDSPDTLSSKDPKSEE